MINWQYFPKSDKIPGHLKIIIEIFEKFGDQIDSLRYKLKSNDVLSIVRQDLEKYWYKVEKSKKAKDKIFVPVLFGLRGKLEKYFEADAYNEEQKTVVEIEAGRGVLNNQFLKDLFQACMMAEVLYLVTAIRNLYLKNEDFNKVLAFYEALYASGRLKLPLKGILIIGY
ncbi:hypothetical protein LCGC14_0564560 [marine sediment metagenome]|uniref:Uncharacterized protein n=1 Tax=marine sediment metagenome TaxID=412755 RepID=A0A0F9RKW1_9ZZZZ